MFSHLSHREAPKTARFGALRFADTHCSAAWPPMVSGFELGRNWGSQEKTCPLSFRWHKCQVKPWKIYLKSMWDHELDLNISPNHGLSWQITRFQIQGFFWPLRSLKLGGCGLIIPNLWCRSLRRMIEGYQCDSMCMHIYICVYIYINK